LTPTLFIRFQSLAHSGEIGQLGQHYVTVMLAAAVAGKTVTGTKTKCGQVRVGYLNQYCSKIYLASVSGSVKLDIVGVHLYRICLPV
jgi:hypothetical protein